MSKLAVGIGFAAVIAGIAYFGMQDAGGEGGGGETPMIGRIMGSPTGGVVGQPSTGVSSPGKTIVNFPDAPTAGAWFQDESGNAFWEKGAGMESVTQPGSKKIASAPYVPSAATQEFIAYERGQYMPRSDTPPGTGKKTVIPTILPSQFTGASNKLTAGEMKSLGIDRNGGLTAKGKATQAKVAARSAGTTKKESSTYGTHAAQKAAYLARSE